ncbi:hypothetical protein PG994_002172 [Apiospora phragmitis]|uniref:Uncharacterized protein n=1 Tax=Apiospora phragmitis TaxID=2905665 RepID=A0ABR1WVK7_9PEZI
MCTTIQTKHQGCGHTQYQNTSHCHVVRRLQSSEHLPPEADEKPSRNDYAVPYPSPQDQEEFPTRRPHGINPRVDLGPNSTPYPLVSSRDDHRLLMQSTKWLPDSQPRVPPGMFACAQNVATRPVDGLCKLCQQQQARNVTPRPRTVTPAAAGTPPQQQSSPQVQSREEGKAKLHKKDKKSEPGSLLTPSAAAATPGSGNRDRSTSTATAGLALNERSPSRSLTPASMFRRAMQWDRSASGTPSSLDVDLTRDVRDSFQRLSIMYGSGTPEPGRSRSASAVSSIPEEGTYSCGANTATYTTPPR